MIVFDLETIPSERALAARDALWRPEWTSEEDFVRYCSTHPALCQIVAACAIDSERTVDSHAQWIAPQYAEEYIIFDLAKFIGRDEFVTFNGGGFDLPVIAHRSRVLGIDVPQFIPRALAQKPWESGPHYDLAQIMRGGSGRMQSLQSYAIAYGLTDPKAGDVSASSVYEAWKAGRVDEIADYCLRDVEATLDLARIWKVIR